jgi:ribosomal-protein-alanine acetyltransferase
VTPTIRQFEFADVAKAAAIAKAAMPYPWSEQAFRDCLKAEYRGFVLVDSEAGPNNILGFVIILLQLDECQLMNIVVDPSCQQQGFGDRLLKYAIQYCRDLSVHHMMLEVRDSNQTAKKLYLNNGFVEVGLRRNYYPCTNGREDAVIYNLVL